MRKHYLIKTLSISALLLAYLALSACNANIGVGLSVGVPIGNHGYINVGTGRWH